MITFVSIVIQRFKFLKQQFGKDRERLIRNDFNLDCSVLGALLSAHLLIVDPLKPFGDLTLPNYNNELLDLAHDLASRLLPAFDRTPHGLPYPRVRQIIIN